MAIAPTTIRNAAIIGLEVDALDEEADSVGESTTTNSTFTDKLTLTFTPATTGNYLIIAAAQVSGDETLKSTSVRLLHDTTSTAYADMRTTIVIADTQWNPWSVMVKLDDLSGEQVFKIQFKRTGAGSVTAKIRQAHFIVLRLDTFDNVYYAESRGNTISASTTYVDKVSLTATPVSCNHIIFGFCIQSASSNSVSGSMRVLVNGETLNESSIEPYGSFGVDQQSYFCMKVRGLANISTDFKLQQKTSSGSSHCKDAAICVLQVGDPPTVHIRGGEWRGGEIR